MINDSTGQSCCSRCYSTRDTELGDVDEQQTTVMGQSLTPSFVPAFAAENPRDVAVAAKSMPTRLYLSHFEVIVWKRE